MRISSPLRHVTDLLTSTGISLNYPQPHPHLCRESQKIGVRRWDDTATAADRLNELTNLAGSHHLTGRTTSSMAVRKAYEAAWRDLVATGDAIQIGDKLMVIASRAGVLTAVGVSEADEMIYIPSRAGIPQEPLLQQAPVLMLPVRDRSLAEEVHALLHAAGARSLRSTADAKVSITIDGLPADMAVREPLLEVAGQWLTTVVLGVKEFRSRNFADVSPDHLRDAARRLNVATLAIADRMSTTIDGHLVDDLRPARSFLLESTGAPCIVVTSTRKPTLHMLQAASHGLAALAEMPQEADSLRLAIMDLRQRCGDETEPTPADIAGVLGITMEDIFELTASYSSVRMDVSRLISVLAVLDPGMAEQLLEARDRLNDADELRSWLNKRLGPHPQTSADALLDLAERGDLLDAVSALGVDLHTANYRLRALSLPPLHNVEGQTRQFATHLQQHRRAIQDRIRDSFLPVYQEGQPLDDYLRLRQLPGLEPDEAWLDQYWNLPEPTITGRIDVWLRQALPGLERALQLPPIEQIREANRRSLTRMLKTFALLTEAWLHRHTSGEGRRPWDSAAVADAMTQAGVLDFEGLTVDGVAAWLEANGRWPVGMPHVTSHSLLGLTDDDLTAARHRLEQAKAEQRRATTFVDMDGQTYSTETDLPALADAIRRGITPSLLASLSEPVVPAEPAAAAKAARTSAGGSGWTASRIPAPEILKTIGFAGEVAAGEWLRNHYGTPIEESWVSGYRNILLGDGLGDDSLGFDFRIVTNERTRLFEVKATTGNHYEFVLGETEVRRAQDLQPNEEYVIIFVTYVLDSSQREIIALPNPLAPGGLHRYRVAGRSIRLQFELSQI